MPHSCNFTKASMAATICLLSQAAGKKIPVTDTSGPPRRPPRSRLARSKIPMSPLHSWAGFDPNRLGVVVLFMRRQLKSCDPPAKGSSAKCIWIGQLLVEGFSSDGHRSVETNLWGTKTFTVQMGRGKYSGVRVLEKISSHSGPLEDGL